MDQQRRKEIFLEAIFFVIFFMVEHILNRI